MTVLAETTLWPEFAWPPSIRAEHWLALVIVLAGMALPDCCLTGHHLFGDGMEAFGPICHASF